MCSLAAWTKKNKYIKKKKQIVYCHLEFQLSYLFLNKFLSYIRPTADRVEAKTIDTRNPWTLNNLVWLNTNALERCTRNDKHRKPNLIRSSLIWIYNVCPDLSVQKLKTHHSMMRAHGIYAEPQLRVQQNPRTVVTLNFDPIKTDS